MKYDMSCKTYSVIFSKLLKKYYKQNFPDIEIKDNIKNIKKEYKAMILRTPALSKDNLMTPNLKGAAYFFAVAKIMPNMSPQLMNKMLDDVMYSKFMVNLYKKARVNGKLFSEVYQEKMYRDSLRSQNSNDEMDWRYTYKKGEKEVYFEMTKCGVCLLARRENLLEFLPCMCHMDYSKFEIQGAKLVRTKTLANNNECCDFHLIKMEDE